MNRDERGTRLGKSANADKVEPFCFMEADGTFSGIPKLYGRLSVVDRFLSNFHKPLQRRMLFTDPKDVLPTSRVIQHCVTKEIYIIGQQRTDSDAVAEYERLNVVHLVSNDSSTFTEVRKWGKPAQQALPSSDPNEMILVPTSIGKFFISLEYQSSRTESYSDREQSTRMLFYAPDTMLNDANELCEFFYNNRWWSIKQVFADSGFTSGTLIDSGQNIEDFRLIRATVDYDPVTGVWDFMNNANIENFSAAWGEDDGDVQANARYGISSSRILYVKAQHIYAYKFVAGVIIQDNDGATWRVVSSRNNRRSPDLQLTVERISQPVTV